MWVALFAGLVACVPGLVAVWAAPKADAKAEAPLLRMPPMAPPVQAWDAFVEPARQGGSVAVRMVLHNPTSDTVAIVGAQSVMAEKVVLNHYVLRDGVTQIYPLPRVEIPAGADLTVVPFGLELRLMNLKNDVAHGMDVPLELRFANGTVRTLRLGVENEMGEDGE